MGDVLYKLQGVPLTDDRWQSSPVRGPFGQVSGVWELLKGTSLLPGTPGFAVTRFTRPGQHGESQAQFAPVTPRSYQIAVRVYAIESDPAMPGFQQEGDTVGDRLRILEDNAEWLLFRTQVGATGTKGYLELERRYSADGPARYASGRCTTSSEPEYGSNYRWADYHMIFDNPFGTWYGDEVTVTETVGASETDILVPMGTAPVWDALIAVKQDGEQLDAGSTFLNDQGAGFEMSRWTTSWWIFNTVKRLGRDAGTGAEPNWARELTRADVLAEIKRPQGSALLINPGVSGNADRVGLVKVHLTSPGTVHIRYRPRYF